MAANAPEELTREQLLERLRTTEAALAEARQAAVDGAFATELRQALIRMGASSQLAAPVEKNDLLDLLVRTAAQVLSAQAASLFLIDRESNELVFEVALGEAAAAARKFRVPLGQGIAGWVALSGQPVARSDVAQDARFAGDIAQRIGYTPKTVLCLPLRSGDDVIGVIELFDKTNGQPFSAGDMQVLEQFGAAAAVALEQERLVRDLGQLFVVVLRGMLPGGSEEAALRQALETRAGAFTERPAQSQQYRDVLGITQLVSEISRPGPEARQHCRQILASVAEYVRAVAERTGGGGWPS
jgi:GAF domain-containing protein